jgi:hypothetical protein
MPPAKHPSPLLDCGASQFASLIKGKISDLAELSSEMLHFTVHTYECMLTAANKVASSLDMSEGAALVKMIVALGFLHPAWVSECKL